MKSGLIALLISGVLGLAACADYSLANRPEVVYSGRGGPRAHISPYPMAHATADIWRSDACSRGCAAKCGNRFNACAKANGDEACRPGLDRCDRICVFECRRSGGPLLYSFE